MRDCTLCVCKHLAQVLVLYGEFRIGHEDHDVWIIGNLAEAESHLIDEHPKEAFAIRDIRKVFEVEQTIDTKQLMEIYNGCNVRHRDTGNNE